MLLVSRTLLAALVLPAAPAAAQTLSLLNVPFLSQSEALCGGAAAAMVLRYWGAQDLTSESFAGLVDQSASGIRTETLRSDLIRRGWNAVSVEDDDAAITRELEAGRPTIALIQDRPGTYHYVVVVGWHARGVVLHDPARVPYRVMAVEEFRRRWRAARMWTLIVTPGDESAGRGVATTDVVPTPLPAPAETLSCDGLVARGVAEAQAGLLDVSERTLSGALGCPGNAALRELAGVRALQRRWPEVIDLASSVVRESPDDAYAWQLLATARFVTNQEREALAAWNEIDQPRLDLVQVDGLVRTRQRVIERLVSLQSGDVLTPNSLTRAGRQLADWPASTSTAVTYSPKPGGRADVRVAVAERDRVPRSPIVLSMIAARALVTREVRVALGPITADGDRLELGWRFWPDRPRYSAGFLLPAPWGGLWGVQAFVERQPLTGPVPLTFEHQSGGVVLSAWRTAHFRWQVGGGLDKWNGLGRLGTVNGAVELVTARDGVRFRARGQSWTGAESFGAVDLSLRGVRAVDEGRYLFDAQVMASLVSSSAPYDIWPAGDNGQARATLMRAHPLVTSGAFRSPRLGATVTTASIELQRVFRYRGARIGPAVFTDIGRTGRRFTGEPIVDTDVGLGIRARIPGMPGALRVDFARGLRDGARAASFIYEP